MLIKQIRAYVNKDNFFNATQVSEIMYSIQAIAGDSSKFFLLLLMFKLLGYEKEYLILFIMTTILRSLIGGLHFKHYLSCLCFSSLYYFVLIRCQALLGHPLGWALLAAGILTIVALSPLIPAHSKRCCKLKKKTVKLAALLIMMLYVFLFLVSQNPFIAMGLLTIIFQAIQLVIMKGGNFLCRLLSRFHFPKKFY